MKREIKFRGLHHESKEWVYGDLITSPVSIKILPIGWEISPELDAIEVDPKTVGQYTGLKDSNGVDIYEGDEVSYNIFASGCKSGEAKLKVTIPDIYLMRSGMKDLQVIGNIHENKKQ